MRDEEEKKQHKIEYCRKSKKKGQEEGCGKTEVKEKKGHISEWKRRRGRRRIDNEEEEEDKEQEEEKSC